MTTLVGQSSLWLMQSRGALTMQLSCTPGPHLSMRGTMSCAIEVSAFLSHSVPMPTELVPLLLTTVTWQSCPT